MFKKIYSKKIIVFVIIFCIAFMPTLLFAQPGFDDDVNDVPIDGGLSILVIAGVGYGVKRLKKNQIEVDN